VMATKHAHGGVFHVDRDDWAEDNF